MISTLGRELATDKPLAPRLHVVVANGDWLVALPGFGHFRALFLQHVGGLLNFFFHCGPPHPSGRVPRGPQARSGPAGDGLMLHLWIQFDSFSSVFRFGREHE